MTQVQTRQLTRRDRNEWQSLLRGFEQSALSVEAYCRRESISAASFYRWRGILGGKASRRAEVAVARDAAPAFVDIGALSAPPVQRPRLDLKLDLGRIGISNDVSRTLALYSPYSERSTARSLARNSPSQ